MNLKKDRIKTPIFFNNLIGGTKKDKDECKTSIFFGSLLSNLFLIALILTARNFIPPEIPLFYGLPEGERQLAPSLLLVIPTSLTAIFTIMNFIICKKSSNIFIKQLSAYILIPLNFFSIIAVIKIILLVGSF